MKNNTVVLFDIDHTLFNTEEFYKSNFQDFQLHEEVKDVLEDVKNIATIGVFSEGDISYQELKLVKTKINDLFHKDYIHIVEKKSENMRVVTDKYKNSKLIFVDDRLDVLYTAKHTNNRIFTIWVKRGYYAGMQKDIPGFSPDRTVKNLTEAAQKIKEIVFYE